MDAFGIDPIWFLENPPKTWVGKLPADRAALTRITAYVLELVLPEWRSARPTDTVPLRAVEAALSNPDGSNDGLKKHAKALAKACGDSRRRSLGYEHRIAEAARAIANATAATSDSVALEAIGEALEKVEEHLLYKLSIDAVYGKEAEVREKMLQRAIEAANHA